VPDSGVVPDIADLPTTITTARLPNYTDVISSLTGPFVSPGDETVDAFINKTFDETIEIAEIVDVPAALTIGGIKKGTTVRSVTKNKEVIQMVTTLVATECLWIKTAAQISGQKVKDNTLNNKSSYFQSHQSTSEQLQELLLSLESNHCCCSGYCCWRKWVFR
jgi:hypothetical protein